MEEVLVPKEEIIKESGKGKFKRVMKKELKSMLEPGYIKGVLTVFLLVVVPLLLYTVYVLYSGWITSIELNGLLIDELLEKINEGKK